MSVLTTFTLLFDTNAGSAAKDVEKLDKGLDKTEKTAKDAGKGMDGFDRANVKTVSSMTSLITKSIAMAGAFVAMKVAAKSFMDQVGRTDELGNFAQTMGFNLDQMYAWGEAAKRTGGSVGAFSASVASLNNNLVEIGITGGGQFVETLAHIGVSAIDSGGKIKDAFELLPELAEVFEGMSAAESANFGRKLGLDQGTIMLLQQSRGEIDMFLERQREIGELTDESREASAAFNVALSDLKQSFFLMMASSNNSILPTLTKILNGFTKIVDWMGNHKDLMIGFFGALIVAITAYTAAMTVAAIATNSALWPVLLIIAAVVALAAAFAIAYEDVKAFMSGNDSLIGKLAERYEWFNIAVQAVITHVKLLLGVLKLVGKLIMEVFDNPREALSNFIDGIKELLESLLPIEKALEKIKSGFAVIKGKVTGGIEAAGKYMSPIYGSPLNSLSSASISNSSASQNNRVNVGGITVNGSGNPEATGAAVNDALVNHFSSARMGFEDGIQA